MKARLWWVICAVVVVGLWTISLPRPAAATESLTENPLIIVGSLTEAEQILVAEEVKRKSPEAVAAREASQTKYEGLSSEQAQKVDGEAFPAVVDEPAGGPPKLPAGQSIAGFISDDAARVDLPEGKHGLLESIAPMALESSSGGFTPVDLGLGEAGGAFEPKTPLVPVRIPKSLGDGVSLGRTGVSLTPADEHGIVLSGSEGAVDGASVLYPNTLTDADTLIKPTTAGFDEDTVLRSMQSAQRLFFRVGMPSDASLVQASGGTGTVEVVKEGVAIASVLAPVASDAAGTSVPVSMRLSGNVLEVDVADGSGAFEYPIMVDPGVIVRDEQLTGNTAPTNWHFCTSVSAECKTAESPFVSSGWGGTSGLSDEATGEYQAGAFAEFRYKTQGESQVFEGHTVSEATNNENPGSNIETSLLLKNENGTINDSTLISVSKNYPSTEYGVAECTNCEHPIENHNSFVFLQAATAAGTHFHGRISSATVAIRQEVKPTITFDTTDEHFVIGGHEYANVLAGKGSWWGHNQGALGFTMEEKGIGISKFNFAEYATGENSFDKQEPYKEGKCAGVQCSQSIKQEVTYNSNMADGEHTVFVNVENAAGGWESKGVTVKADNTPPHGLVVTGLPSSGVINEAQYHLQARATDGKPFTASSGIKSLALAVDGFVLPGKAGVCAPGPCTASGEWAINGEEFGAGKHTLTLQAIDNAGNEEKQEYSFTVRHANALPAGPGSVDPITGALYLGANDVSISGGSGSLSLSRSYDSRQLTAGEQGPFGPQWGVNLSGSRAIERESTGAVTLVSSDGQRTTFESNGKGGFISPPGDENLVLEAEKEGETVKAYLLKDPAQGTTVKYVQVGGAGPWVIASSEGALSKSNGGKETVEWERLEGVTRPKLALAPAPKGVTCSATVKEPKELAAGCRALSFTYATETTATGEAPSEWKAYKGRLVRVSFTAYNPSAKAMETTPVAEYAYDKQGRLRVEWDPRFSPALKTTYGYDSEGHVTSVNPAGQEPSLLHYGTTAADTSAGRLLSVTRLAAGTAAQVKEQDEKAAPVNTAVPTLSNTSPVVGATLSVSSDGTWSNSPLAYSYAWEDCYTYESKETCTAIPGADNGTYTPQERDAGYTLRAQVTAVNADGAAVATSVASKALAGTAPAYLSKFGEKGSGEKQFNAPDAVAVDSSGNVWVVDHANNRIQEWSSTGTWLHTYGKEGSGQVQFKEPQGIAINSGGNVYVADTGNNRIEELSSAGAYVRAFGLPGKEPGRLTNPQGVTIAPNGNVWVGDTGNNRVDEFSETGEYLGSFGEEGSGTGQLKSPDGISFSGENAYVVDSGNDRVQEFSLSGQYIAKFGVKGTGNGQFEAPAGIASEPVSGALWVADSGNSRIEEFNPAGVFLIAYGKKGEGTGEFSSPPGVAVNASGDAYIADSGNNRVEELEPKYSTSNPLPEPPALGTSFVTTIDYNVPLWGEGAPDTTAKNEAEMKAEREKWGQKDDPVEAAPGQPLATAIFPPDEPMGWPAKDYKRATITYYDNLGRTVNRAVPSGGIFTSEYNEYNNVIRSLSADNRAAALKETCESKEKCKSAEKSELLDTKSNYSGETSAEREAEEKNQGFSEPGVRLLESTGPEHTIRLAGSTTEKQARNNAKYYYDEGAPEGERYNLVTKMIDRANYEGLAHETRTTTTSYSGQENLGWKLRKPTSVTTDPSGLKLVHTTLYDPHTGNVTETRTPAAGANGTPVGVYEYVTQITTAGTTPVSVKAPAGVVLDSSGHVWVADTGSARVDEYSATGEYITRFGSEGTGNGQFKEPRGIAIDKEGHVWVADTGNNRVQELSSTGTFIRAFGKEGTGNGEFKKPKGIAIDSSSNVWVADTENNRVQEFNSKGEFILAFGKEGTGNGEFKKPDGLAFNAEGDVWVAEGGEAYVQEFSSTGTFIKREVVLGDSEGITVDSKGNIWVTTNNNFVWELSSAGKIIGDFGKSGSGNGEYKELRGIAIDKEGTMWLADAGNNRIQKLIPHPPSPHASQTIYYSAGANSTYPECGLHPEWANLPCRSQLAIQPAKGDLLPVVTDTYNMWDEPETILDEFGSATRTKKMSYDSAGRLLTNEETSTINTALPKVTNRYDEATGEMIEQSTTSGETTKTIKSVYDTVGQLTAYTDADGNTTQYTYSGPANDGMVEEVSYGGKKGSQIYSYNATTKAVEKLTDVGAEGGQGAGTFTASYDVEGKMASETYPNGMTAKYTYNSVSEATGMEYEKTTHCTEKCVWFSETVAPAIHGETLARTSTLAKEEYTYDNASRLTQVNETPTGKGCKTRIYAYNENSDRTSETTRESSTETCATTGGATESHTYDEADRLIDTGVEYEALGDQTKIPAADAGEHEITASFYVDNQVAVQKQNGETTNYTYDPAGRTEKTVSEGTTKATVINHFPGPGEGISWSCEENAKECEEGKATTWTRNIAGIDGSLAATQHNTEAAVLQLHDLGGNIIATAAVSETDTKLLTTYNSTEFGVPVNGTPPTKFSWLGASGYTPQQASGQANPGGSTYVPQLGAPLQTEPVAPPGAPNGTYVSPYITGAGTAVDYAGDKAYAAAAPEREAGRQAAAKRQQEEEEAQARKNAELEAMMNPPTPTEGGAEGPGEETFGDPTHCYVGGDLVQSNGKAIISGYGGCNGGLPAGTWLKVCVEDRSEFGPNFVRCNQAVVKGHTSRYWSLGIGATIPCSGGDLYRAYVAFFVPGGRTLYAIMKQEECGAPYTEDLEAVSQTVFEEFIGTWDDP